MKKSCLLTFVFFFPLLFTNLNVEAQPANSTKNLSKLKGFFIENKGQMSKDVKFYFQGNDFVYFTNEGIIFQKIVRKDIPVEKNFTEYNNSDSLKQLSYKVGFLNSKKITPKGKGKLPGIVNYYKGKDPKKWLTKLSTYQEVVYPNIYEKIDLVYKGIPGGIKYEYIVHPKADIKSIKLFFVGIEGLDIDSSGNLIIKTKLGDTKEIKPFTYQDIRGKRIEVECKYKIIDMPQSTVSFNKIDYPVYNQGIMFEVSNYNERYPLLIDPEGYSTFLGGGDDDSAESIAVDANGNAYITGHTNSSSSNPFPTTNDAEDSQCNRQDAYVVKLNNSGSQLIYSTFIGGRGYEYGKAIAIDESYNAYITGQTNSDNFTTTENAYCRSFSYWNEYRFDEVFLVKLDQQGRLLYSTYIGGNNIDFAEGITLEKKTNNPKVFITGFTRSNNFPTTNSYGQNQDRANCDLSSYTCEDAFIVKINPSGHGTQDLIYSTILGGQLSDWGEEIITDNLGFVYVVGSTSSIYFPGREEFFGENNIVYGMAFLVLLNPHGEFLWSYFFPGWAPNNISIDSDSIFLAGTCYPSSLFPYTLGETEYRGNYDTFLINLNLEANEMRFFNFLGGREHDDLEDIKIDGFSNIYMTGSTESRDFPTEGDYDHSHNGGLIDAFVAKFSNQGVLTFSTYLGGEQDDKGVGIAIEPKLGGGCIYITGYTNSENFPTTSGAFDRSYNGGDCDAFVTKLYKSNEKPNLPDLVSVPLNRFWVEPTTSSNGDRVSATLKIKNIGTMDATKFNVKIYLSGWKELEPESVLVQATLVPRLAVGQIKTIPINFRGRISAKRNKFLIAKIDADGVGEPYVIEINENNNLAVGGIP